MLLKFHTPAFFLQAQKNTDDHSPMDMELMQPSAMMSSNMEETSFHVPRWDEGNESWALLLLLVLSSGHLPLKILSSSSYFCFCFLGVPTQTLMEGTPLLHPP